MTKKSMTEIKGEIDNVTVGMLNGDDNLGGEGSDDGMGDFEADFGEFNADDGSMESETELDTEETSEDGSLDDLTDSLESLSREEK